MRKFTDAEKQQLQAKIKNGRKQQYQTVRRIARKNDEAPNKILFLLSFWNFSGFWSD